MALETSCDDTCAAVLDAQGVVRANAISSQGVHDRFGGIVPEVASRHHLELVNLLVEQALGEAGVTLDEIELVAATRGPGLVGALLVGLSTAKALAAARELPFVPVDHLQGHVAANFIAAAQAGDAEHVSPAHASTANVSTAHASTANVSTAHASTANVSTAHASTANVSTAHASTANVSPADGPTAHASKHEPCAAFEPPFVCLIASGGHTLLTHVTDYDGFRVLGRTLDDAAGEAFDKGARMLGLGYPGGAALERLADGGDPDAFVFPGSRAERARGGKGTDRQTFERGLDFSFAGLKTALLYRLRDLSAEEIAMRASDLAASYQAAIVDSLLVRAEQGLEETGLDRLAVGGGVAANGELRRRLQSLRATVHVPARELCTDNAAMIASAARFADRLEYPAYLGLDAYATGERPR